jgi:hypothetical protein
MSDQPRLPTGSRTVLGCLSILGVLVVLPGIIGAIAWKQQSLVVVLALVGTGLFWLSVPLACFFKAFRARALRITAAIICFLCIFGLVMELGLSLDYTRGFKFGSILAYLLVGTLAGWVAIQGRIPRRGWLGELLDDAFGAERSERSAAVKGSKHCEKTAPQFISGETDLQSPEK